MITTTTINFLAFFMSSGSCLEDDRSHEAVQFLAQSLETLGSSVQKEMVARKHLNTEGGRGVLAPRFQLFAADISVVHSSIHAEPASEWRLRRVAVRLAN